MVSKSYNLQGHRDGPSNWHKYRLLMWKNWIIGFRNKWGLAKDISTPVLFSVMILLTRYFIEPEVVEQDIAYQAMPVNNMPWLQGADSPLEVDNWNLAYSPTGPAIDEFMEIVSDKLNLTGHGFPSRSALEDYLSVQTHYPFACVHFNDSLRFANGSLPRRITYDIRFPSLRRVGNGNWNTDRTNRRISPSVIWAPQDPWANSPYMYEGFLAIQHVISMEFIEQSRANESVEIPTVMIQRQPFPASRMDFAVNIMSDLLSAVLIISFLPTCMNMTKILAVEKEKQLKDIMKIMGLPNWLHWSSWFSKFFIQMLIVVSFMIAIFKVPFHDGVSIFTNSNWMPVWLFLFTYAISVVMFSFLISVIVKSPSSASLLAGVVMFVIYVPYFIILNLGANPEVSEIMGLSLFNSLGMAFGFNFILKLEDRRVGLHWSNLFEPIETANGMCVGNVMIMLIVSSFVYLILALYIEKVMPGNFGIPEKWYFPFDPKFWFRCLRVSSGGSDIEGEPTDIKIEPRMKDKKVGISIRRLRKVYSTGKVAVQGLKLNLYEDEITVLLGHNGAGKTTTISMLTGMIPATAGTAFINGFDINTEMDQIRGEIGICPQHNILFDELTVEEHFLFYSKLKGMTHDLALEEVQKYVKSLQLLPKISAQSKTLSGGMKRKLCIGIALCGESKFILLDEPTAGMDPTARRALWDLLQMEKRNRTIILSTHFMDEADVLGDAIAIMHDGQLKCYGSSYFLKKEFGDGYSLTFEKSKMCNVKDVTTTLEEYIPNIEMTANVGTELSFKLPERYAKTFQEMLSRIEDQSEKLGILGYGISVTTLEEVFLSVGSDTKTIMPVPSEEDINGESETGSTITILDPPDLLQGRQLRNSQWLAMFMKIYFYSIRNWGFTLLKIVTPTIFVLLTVVAARAFARVTRLPDIPVNMTLYDFRTETIVQRNFDPIEAPVMATILNNYRTSLNESGEHRNVRETNEFIIPHLLRIGRNDFAEFTRHYLISASFSEEEIVALFSNQYYHTTAIAVQHIYDAILRSVAGSEFSLRLRNYPMPFTTVEGINFADNQEDIGFQIMLNMGCGMVIVMALYIIFYIKEESSKAKLLQFVSGVKVWTFWISTISSDFLIYLLSIALMSSILTVFNNPGWQNGEDIARTFALFTCFGIATLPLIYLYAMANKDSANGFCNISMIGFGLILLFVLNRQLRLEIVDMEELAEAMDWVFILIPYYNFAHALFHTNKMNAIINNCNNLCSITQNCTDSVTVCDIRKECCNLNPFKFESPGIGRNILFLIITGIILFAFLFLKEFGHFKTLYYKIFKSKDNKALEMISKVGLDSDVLDEKTKVRNMSLTEIKDSNMVIRNMTKVYKDFPAVKGISVSVKDAECFGLLGVNGAGKTSTFKMLTGDEVISYGEAWIKGFSLKNEINKVHSQIGYCPQFNAMLEDMTGRETMTIFCLLRGIPRNKIPNFIFRLARELNFMQHLNKRIHQYSGGNKRKLSTALALIGNPSVIFLDEPTAGMDPGAKRNLWDVVSRVRDTGKTVILTSHSMEECEALCTRITIMVNGEFKCLGSLQYLKNKFSKGFILTVQVMRSGAEKEVCKLDIKAVHDYIQEHLTGAELKEDYQGRLTYYINNTRLKWSAMFGVMETAKDILRIENYSLTQTTLEQIFLDFAQHQKS